MSENNDRTDERVAREALTHDSPFYPIAPERMLLETRQCVAFLDKYPVSKGHALVAAKTVTASLFDLPVEVQAEVWETVRQARAVLIRRYQPDGFNIGINDGPAAGQTVAHAHVHIIPRYRNDVSDPRGGIRRIILAKARYR
jgi:diadenosine tetraphosphate (Ap4A) HIT family hydrolase